MTRTALLHLGMNKAGSTTLQVAFRAYDAPGITWLQAPPFSHTQLVCLPFRHPPPAQLHGVSGAEARAQECRDARAALDRALGATGKSVILSSEFLSDFRDPADISALCAALFAHVDEVRALVYLRAPEPYLVSVFQQVLKQRPPPRALARLWPDYRARIAPWDAVLGAERVTVRPFARAAFAGGDLLTDFARHAGLAPDTLPRTARRANESLSAEAVALLHAYRLSDLRPAAAPGLVRAENKTVFMLKGFGNLRLRFGQRLLRPLLTRQAEDIAWAEARQGAAFAPEGAGGQVARIASLDALSELADAQAPVFCKWLSETHPDLAALQTPGSGPAAQLAAIVRHHLTAG